MENIYIYTALHVEHNRQNSGALLQIIIGNFKSIMDTSLKHCKCDRACEYQPCKHNYIIITLLLLPLVVIVVSCICKLAR